MQTSNWRNIAACAIARAEHYRRQHAAYDDPADFYRMVREEITYCTIIQNYLMVSP